MKVKKINWIVIASVLLVTIILGIGIMGLPNVSKDLKGFSAENASGYLKVISQKPHSVFDTENHESVRQYIKMTLNGMNYDVAEHNWTPAEHGFKDNITPEKILDHDVPVAYDIKNLTVKIQGKSDTGMLLMAHYDSRGHASRVGEITGSYGAADDGYGVSVLLEIARLYQNSNGTLENSLYICFTDAEETGLYGAKLEMTKDYVKNVNFVVNVEARGVKGPAYMFETSKKNKEVINLYKKASMPFAYSLATAVYTVMPNYTDFGEALAIGKAGINFAVLDNLFYYHTPADNFSNINKNSIQHYGEQLTPIIKEYTSNAKYNDLTYFDSQEDSIFFNILPGVMAVYTDTFAIVMVLLTVVAFGVILYFLVKNKIVSVKGLLKALGIVVLAVLGAAVFGFGLSMLTALIAGVPWKLTYVRVACSGIPFALSFMIVLAAVIWFAIKKLNSKNTKLEFLTAGVSLNLLFALLSTFLLSGASFVFLWPALIGSVTLFVNYFTKNYYANHVAHSANLVFSMLLNVPLLYSLFLAVSIGGLLALNLFFVMTLVIIIPSIMLQKDLELKPALEKQVA